jgi:hypothetical protein
MLVFKEGIEGFLYDSQLGGCYPLDCDFEFEFPYSDVGDVGLVLVNNVEDLNAWCGVNSAEELLDDEEGLNDFVEFRV